MTHEQDYLQQVKDAVAESIVGDGTVTPDAEALLANLAARGYLVVETPPGLKTDFIGVAG